MDIFLLYTYKTLMNITFIGTSLKKSKIGKLAQ